MEEKLDIESFVNSSKAEKILEIVEREKVI